MFNPEAGQREPEQEIPQEEEQSKKRIGKENKAREILEKTYGEGRSTIIVDKSIPLAEMEKDERQEDVPEKPIEQKRAKKQESTVKKSEKLENEEESEELNKARDELKNQFNKKSLAEKFVAEYQTRESKGSIRSIERGESTRYERGQIYKAYKILRKEIREAEKNGERVMGKRELLGEMRSRAKEVEADLDEVERQLKENVQMVDVETSDGKFSMPVAVLDLKKPEAGDGKKDDRVPYVFWGGIRANEQMDGCAMMAMALTGKKIYHVAHLEQKDVKKPENTREIVGQRGDFGLQAEITEKVAEAMDLEKFNLMGYSTGASVALETAIRMSKEGTSGKINDLIVIEPLGLEKLGILKLGYNFGIKEGLLNLSILERAEAGIKVMRQGGKTNKEDAKFSWLTTAPILAKKHFDANNLSSIKIGGKMQWWLGGRSPVTNSELTKQVAKEVAENNPNLRQEVNVVKGATHSILNMNALGLAHEFSGDRGGRNLEIRDINRKDLANSATSFIIKNIKTKNR